MAAWAGMYPGRALEGADYRVVSKQSTASEHERPSAASLQRIFIDADTANEIDDLYAIVRALIHRDFEITALSSAQWHHQLAPDDTVIESQRMNEDILSLMGRDDIPHPQGAERIMGQPWGGDEPSESDAASLMIEHARASDPTRKLTVVCLGAVTNFASAVRMAPDIIPNVRCFMLAGKYFADRDVWDKDEFNVRNDLNATNYLFNASGLELHVMPVNILYDFTLDRDTVWDRLEGAGGVWTYLARRWKSYSPESGKWIMWDLALVLALIRPDLARSENRRTPPENVEREIEVFTAIDVEEMRADWWDAVHRALNP